MPSTLTYANRHGHKITDTIDNYPNNKDTSSDDKTYTDSEQSNDNSDGFAPAPLDNDSSSNNDSDSDSDTRDSDNTSDASDDSDNDHLNIKHNKAADGPALRVRFQTPPEQLIVINPTAPHVAINPGVGNPGNPGVEYDLRTSDVESDDANEEDEEQDANEENEEQDGNGEQNEQNNNEDDPSQASQISAHDKSPTESERFRAAENEGRARAIQPNNTRPTQNVRNTRHDNFAYTAIDVIRRTIGVRVPDCKFVHSCVTVQMSAKKGLKVFGKDHLVLVDWWVIRVLLCSLCLPNLK